MMTIGSHLLLEQQLAKWDKRGQAASMNDSYSRMISGNVRVQHIISVVLGGFKSPVAGVI
jgi:hypothetical protein